MTDENVSSAEVTAYMRSQKPDLTHDKISGKLVSEAGIRKYYDFVEGMDYPLATRKIIVRAGYFYEQALALLQTDNYDSCISFASGFSLLLNLLAEKTANIAYYDVDLPHMIEERIKRIKKSNIFSREQLKQVNTKSLDLTQINQIDLQDIFPDCKKPLFILEGITYFLPEEIVTAILKLIFKFNGSAIILDYWPVNSLEISAIFKRIMHQLKGFIAENLNSFLTKKQVNLLKQHYAQVEDLSILEADELLSKNVNEQPELIDQNEVFPIRILMAR
jgi:O-methyltransferase involved in polyketide biosynthesis